MSMNGLTAFLQCSVALESQNEQTAAEGREEHSAMSGLTAFLQVFRASGRKVSQRLQRGVGYGCREAFRLQVSFHTIPGRFTRALEGRGREYRGRG